MLGVVAAARQGPGAAWDAVVRDHKTHLIGPAFGTKVAYFAAFSDPAPSLR